MSSIRYLIGGASVFCGATILASLLFVGLLFQDINNFYDDAISDMGEFKVSNI